VNLVDQKQPSLELALQLLERVRTEAAARELALAMCVVDAGGHVLAAQRMDGAALGAMRLAEGKAYTAVLWGTRTGDFTESTQPGGADRGWNTTDDRIVVYAGGIPLIVEGRLVGGLGASGGAADDDEACVVVAAESLGFG
jgi:cob(I)alamin adenosyltransferase